MPDDAFAARLIAWQKIHGRHDLPWQNTRDAYRIWVSEIMLQQTQVSAVLGYYQRFMQRFPSVESLAEASLDTVLGYWSGLGYYSRARNLHACAQKVVERYAGRFPSEPSELAELPGIGPSTAAAIAAFAYGRRAAILDGNVKRVLCRQFGVQGFPGERAVELRLWAIAREQMPELDVEAYTQGLMDLGSSVCTRTRPRCVICPVAERCVARLEMSTDRLPAPRPKKTKPHKVLAVLVLVRDGRVVLEKRPVPGVWGGLWSLPECAPDKVPICLQQAFGVPAASPQFLPVIEHAFTHFTLSLQPFRIDLSDEPRLAPNQAWIALAELDVALPAPIKRLLQFLAADSTTINTYTAVR